MKIDIQDIFYSTGSLKSFETTVDLSGEEYSDYQEFESPVSVKGTFRNRSGVVTLDIHLSAALCCVCDRCLQSFIWTVSKNFHHVVTSQQEDSDIIIDKNGMVDISMLIWEDILLEMPSKMLCTENCVGICPVCGKNLNDGLCPCEQ